MEKNDSLDIYIDVIIERFIGAQINRRSTISNVVPCYIPTASINNDIQEKETQWDCETEKR